MDDKNEEEDVTLTKDRMVMNMPVLSASFNSSNIRGVEYDTHMKTLTVYFHSGAVYDFIEVPKRVYHEMQDAPSVGRFFHNHIRGEFDAMRRA